MALARRACHYHDRAVQSSGRKRLRSSAEVVNRLRDASRRTAHRDFGVNQLLIVGLGGAAVNGLIELPGRTLFCFEHRNRTPDCCPGRGRTARHSAWPDR